MAGADRSGSRPGRRGCCRPAAPGLRLVLMVLSALPAVVVEDAVAQGRRPSRGLQVSPVRDLRFGTVVPGMVTRVSPDRQQQAGMFGITGEKDMSVRVDLLLPNAMVTATGDQFPILFGRADGAVSGNRGRGQLRVFDPNQPLITTLGRNGRLFVRLGGSVAPARFQVGGAYSATITLTVANLGN